VLGLVKTDGVILDMVVESRERGIDISSANSELGEFLGGFKLGNAYGKKGFGGDRAFKPNALLKLGSRMNQNMVVEVQNLGSPGIQKSKARLLPSGV
jgi:hypothetical protein